MFRTKHLEARVVAAVARERGGTRLPEPGAWPDGWIVDARQRVPVEVVSAFLTTNGTIWARAHQRGAREARGIHQRTGEFVSWTVHDGRAIVLEATTEMPVDLRPTDVFPGILSAIDTKSAQYAPTVGASAILALQHVVVAVDAHAVRVESNRRSCAEERRTVPRRCGS